MDLLYSRYASPFELMSLYINQGRLGEFVSEILEMNFRRQKEAAEKENDERLWSLYIHSMPEMTFTEWKESLSVSAKNKEAGKAVSKMEVNAAIQRSKEILRSFVPE